MAFDVLTTPTRELQPERPVRGTVRGRLADVAVLALLAWWGTFLTWGSGGREPHLLSVGLGVLALALLLVQPWRSAAPLVLGAALAVSGAAMLVPVVAPTGLAGASEGASWVFAAATALSLSVWVDGSWRREAVLVTLTAAPLLTFSKGWTAWWGGGDPARPFVGTFYWHNQQAIFLVVGVIAGLALALQARGPLRIVGCLAVALCGAGVVVSTSRASMAVLALALLTLLGAALITRTWGVALRVAGASAAVAATSWLITGPPFFATRSGVVSGTQQRSGSGETLAANGGYRLEDWGWAVKVFRHWPLSGSGFHGFAAASRQVDPADSGSLTPFAHNGYLQLLVDGGLLLAVPVLLAVACMAVLGARRSMKVLRARDWTGACLVIVLAALALHSGADFDWSYPSLLAALGITAGALAADLPAAQGSRRRTLAGGLVLVLVLVSVVAAWPGGMDLSAPLGSHA